MDARPSWARPFRSRAHRAGRGLVQIQTQSRMGRAFVVGATVCSRAHRARPRGLALPGPRPTTRGPRPPASPRPDPARAASARASLVDRGLRRLCSAASRSATPPGLPSDPTPRGGGRPFHVHHRPPPRQGNCPEVARLRRRDRATYKRVAGAGPPGRGSLGATAAARLSVSWGVLAAGSPNLRRLVRVVRSVLPCRVGLARPRSSGPRRRAGHADRGGGDCP